MIEVLYRGFDGLDLAMQGALPHDLIAKLNEAKTQAQTGRHAVLVTYGGVSFHVAETGRRTAMPFAARREMTERSGSSSAA